MLIKLSEVFDTDFAEYRQYITKLVFYADLAQWCQFRYRFSADLPNQLRSFSVILIKFSVVSLRI